MTNRFFHGTRIELTRGDLIAAAPLPGAAGGDRASARVFLTPTLDEAIWSAELADGDSAARVYVVETLGSVERAADQPGYEPPGHRWADVKLTLRDRWMRVGKPPAGSSPDEQQEMDLNRDARRDVKEGEGRRLRR